MVAVRFGYTVLTKRMCKRSHASHDPPGAQHYNTIAPLQETGTRGVLVRVDGPKSKSEVDHHPRESTKQAIPQQVCPDAP